MIPRKLANWSPKLHESVLLSNRVEVYRQYISTHSQPFRLPLLRTKSFDTSVDVASYDRQEPDSDIEGTAAIRSSRAEDVSVVQV